jgi:hypothetical protein
MDDRYDVINKLIHSEPLMGLPDADEGGFGSVSDG